MTTTTRNKASIPGVINVGQRVVTTPVTRAEAIRSQTQLEVDAFQELSLQKKALEQQLEELRGRLICTMQATKQLRLLSTDSQFAVTLKERSNWTYSDELEDRLQLLKAEQKNEQRKGIAINNPTTYVDGRAVAANS